MHEKYVVQFSVFYFEYTGTKNPFVLKVFIGDVGDTGGF